VGWIVAACAPSNIPLPAKVGVSLVSAAATADHRVLVFRACQGGHCFSDTYLQWLYGDPPAVIHTSRVDGFGEGTVVRDIRWARLHKRSALVATIDTRQPDADPLTLYLLPGEPGYYQVRR
jgi:hypothetical protein